MSNYSMPDKICGFYKNQKHLKTFLDNNGTHRVYCKLLSVCLLYVKKPHFLWFFPKAISPSVSQSNPTKNN